MRHHSAQVQFEKSETPPIVFGENFLFKIGWHPACLTYSDNTSESRKSSLFHPKWLLYTPSAFMNHVCLGGKNKELPAVAKLQ